MIRLQGANLYLAELESEDCQRLWKDFEYDFKNPTEELNVGHSREKADDWFQDIQKAQGNRHIRLGIFLNNGVVIGDVALQNIDRTNRKCDVGMVID